MVTVILLKSLPVCTRRKWSLSVSPRLYQSRIVTVSLKQNPEWSLSVYNSHSLSLATSFERSLSDSSSLSLSLGCLNQS